MVPHQLISRQDNRYGIGCCASSVLCPTEILWDVTEGSDNERPGDEFCHYHRYHIAMDLLTECNIPILNDCLEEGAGVLCSRTYVVNKPHLLDHLQRHFIVFWNDLILVCSESTRVHSCLLFHVRWRHSVVEYLLAFAVGLCITNFFHNHIFHNNFLWSIKKWCSKGETHNSKSKVSWLRSISFFCCGWTRGFLCMKRGTTIVNSLSHCSALTL